MFYRDLAPISKEAWNEIDERAAEVLKSFLSARKAVRVNGPLGIDFNVITEGRLEDTVEGEDLCYGNYKVLPLTEARIEFEMNRWELDNVERGAKDVDYEALENAAEKMALFEEKFIFDILDEYAEEIPMGKELESIMEAVSKGIIKLRKAYQKGPFNLIVNEEIYKRILSANSSYPLEERIEQLIGGKIILNHVTNGAYLLPHDHEDLELTIGQDYAIGYQSHTSTEVRFFMMESFTFRVLDPEIIVKFKAK